MIKTITGTLLDALGVPIEGAILKFQLDNLGLHAGSLYSPHPIVVSTDPMGGFTINLWVNQTGLSPTKYRVTINSGPYVYISIPDSLDPSITITDIIYDTNTIF